ncbi:MAG: peptide deformylase [Puniceicoccales bacterium]|jgi:peptide deformylase|nr:peptide deformylase [Puniceicoccales bacterium]
MWTSMAVLPICLLGNPVLRAKTTEVSVFDEPRRALYGQMLEAMYRANGIGIAAPQVGWTERVFLIDLGAASTRSELVGSCRFDGQPVAPQSLMPLTFINPVITEFSEKKAFVPEGCLSIPKISGSVERSLAVTVSFQDSKGEKHTLACEKLLAQCVQHEFEHLEGVLWIDHLDTASRARLRPRLEALERRGRRQKIPLPLASP